VWSPFVLIAVLIIHVVAFGISVSESAQPAGDFDRYYEIASSGASASTIKSSIPSPRCCLKALPGCLADAPRSASASSF
jgi:hypothetical protein